MSPSNDKGESLSDSTTTIPDSINAESNSNTQLSMLSSPSIADSNTSFVPNTQSNLGIPETPDQHVYKNQNITTGDDGYDSDGLQAPWTLSRANDGSDLVEAEDELPVGEQILDAMVGIENSAASNTATEGTGTSSSSTSESVLLYDDMMKMKVAELRDSLRKRGLKVTGNKGELQMRMTKALEDRVPLLTDAIPTNAGDVSSGGSETLVGGVFDSSAYWEVLEQDGKEHHNQYDIDGVSFRGPTEPENESRGRYQKKKDYTHGIDRGVFTGQAKFPMFKRNGNFKTDKNGDIEYEKRPCFETVPDIDWCVSKGLNLESSPAEWFDAFVPIKNGRGSNSGHSTMAFSVENCLSWTNTKARMMNAGLGGMYDEFTNFNLTEFCRHIALYLFQGLSPSPQIEMKFKSNREDPVNGNDFIHTSFGSSSGRSARRHRHFKCFFACVDPTYPTPSRDTHPNWKVHPLLKHILKVSKDAVKLGQHLSCDEQTVGFQGNHKDKQRITYKNEGDGFLADCICSDGYTYNFFFRHQSVKTSSSLSPLHVRVLTLCSQLPDKYYTLGMDNLYNSTKLCRHAYSLKQKVMTHGVTRPSLRGVPDCVKQSEVTRKGDLEKVRHTVKAAVVKGDSVCNGLICVSIYDSKPVYILTNACSEIKWIEKSRKVWHPQHKKYVNVIFNMLNIIDFYNKHMGYVDLSDQLRNQYRYDNQWHRNRKWWWSLWWWGFQLLLTNTYVSYVKFQTIHKREVKYSHYEFIRSIALAWIDPSVYWVGGPLDISSAGSNARKRKRSGTSSGIRRPSNSSSSNIPLAQPVVCNTRRKVVEMKENKTKLGQTKRVTEIALHPVKGNLKERLNSALGHHPIVMINDKARHKCQLHRWARGRDGKEVRGKGIMRCSVCSVHLCSACWQTFHECEDIVSKKEKIAK